MTKKTDDILFTMDGIWWKGRERREEIKEEITKCPESDSFRKLSLGWATSGTSEWGNGKKRIRSWKNWDQQKERQCKAHISQVYQNTNSFRKVPRVQKRFYYLTMANVMVSCFFQEASSLSLSDTWHNAAWHFLEDWLRWYTFVFSFLL